MRRFPLVPTLALAGGCALAAGGALAVAAPSPVPLTVAYHDAASRLIGAALSSDHAYLRLSQLCDGIGNRHSGSPALERAVAWVASTMREDGLERVHLQPVMIPRWVRG